MIWFFVCLIVAGFVGLVVAFISLLDLDGRGVVGMVVGAASSVALFVGLVGLAWELGPLVWLWIAGGR
jgi:hypothetical protein